MSDDTAKAMGEYAAATVRARRQRRGHQWALDCFGEDFVRNPKERAMRVVEEAIEFAQACGASADMINRITANVYSKEPGVPKEELAQVMFTSLIAAQTLGEDADALETGELHRVLQYPPDYFTKRMATKIKAGVTTWNE